MSNSKQMKMDNKEKSVYASGQTAGAFKMMIVALAIIVILKIYTTSDEVISYSDDASNVTYFYNQADGTMWSSGNKPNDLWFVKDKISEKVAEDQIQNP